MAGNNLKKLRNDKGLTQGELGELFGLTKTAISLYESGKRGMDTELIKSLANYFKVTTDYLLGQPSKKEFQDIPIIAESPGEYELLQASKKLTSEQFDVVLSVVKAIVEGTSEKDEIRSVPKLKFKKESSEDDPVAKLPYWHQRLKALRMERGLSVAEAAKGIAAIHNNFLTPDILADYEAGRKQIEPNDQASMVLFYQTSWAFISGRTNIRRGYAGPAPVAMEIAHRTDNTMTPLPKEAEESINRFKKMHGLYIEEGDEEIDS